MIAEKTDNNGVKISLNNVDGFPVVVVGFYKNEILVDSKTEYYIEELTVTSEKEWDHAKIIVVDRLDALHPLTPSVEI